MKISVIPGKELDAALIAAWRALQKSNPLLVSPYFCPEFTRAIATVCDNVEIAIIEDEGKIEGFLPYQKKNLGIGKPVGEYLSDCQGLICGPAFYCDPLELVRACGLVAWDFDHLLAGQTFFSPFHHLADVSPIIDLRVGFDAYAAQCHAVRAERRKLRRLEREVGPVRLVVHSRESSLLDRLLLWKSGQYQRTSQRDIFAEQWVRSAVHQIMASENSSDFAPMLSFLYAGDNIVAGHFGMRSDSVWHYWFPAYPIEFSQYSPGLALLIKMAEQAPALGLQVIDFGKGQMLYKERFKNADIALAVGSVERPSLVRAGRRLRRVAREAVRDSIFEKPARRLISAMRG